VSIKTIKNETVKTIENDFRDAERAASKSLHAHWMLYLLEGVVLAVMGAVVLVMPPIAMTGLSLLLGAVLLVSGVMGLLTTFWARDAPGFWWSLLSAILGIVVGLTLFAMPVEGGFLLTVLLVAFFIVEGAASIMFALEHKREMAGKWEWMLVSGVLDLVMGVLIFTYLPSATAWEIGGLLVGINMVVGGAALIIMALHARNAAAQRKTRPI
jgi:uncharacterized membrane protein HdeD (DUF308 family)